MADLQIRHLQLLVFGLFHWRFGWLRFGFVQTLQHEKQNTQNSGSEDNNVGGRKRFSRLTLEHGELNFMAAKVAECSVS